MAVHVESYTKVEVSSIILSLVSEGREQQVFIAEWRLYVVTCLNAAVQ
jgi:hypothetical protein